MPILQALQITKDTLSNGLFMKAMGNVHDSVQDGEAMAVQMEREEVFPTMVASMVEIGEETGELPNMLTRIADNYDEGVDNAVAGMTSLIEPIMIVFLAVVVGFIVISTAVLPSWPSSRPSESNLFQNHISNRITFRANNRLSSSTPCRLWIRAIPCT